MHRSSKASPGAFLLLLLLRLLCGAVGSTIVALDGSISVNVSASSGLESVTVGPHTFVVRGALTTLSAAGGAVQPPPPTTCLLAQRESALRAVGDGVSVSRHWECQSPHGAAAVVVTDTFAGNPNPNAKR